MTRIKQNPNGHGSLKDIQLLINNNNAQLINNHIRKSFKDLSNDEITWVSPLKEDDYAEYRDNEFIQKIGLNPNKIKLEDFWPKRGPQWDALAKTNNGKIIIVEAKANIPELVSPATKANGKSKNLIDLSLNKTKNFLNITNDTDWSGKFFQYTNRLAHLYFLREMRNKDAYLINIYFVGDQTVSGPKNKLEWDGALKLMKVYLGVSGHRLKKYMADIFIDISDLKTTND